MSHAALKGNSGESERRAPPSRGLPSSGGSEQQADAYRLYVIGYHVLIRAMKKKKARGRT